MMHQQKHFIVAYIMELNKFIGNDYIIVSLASVEPNGLNMWFNLIAKCIYIYIPIYTIVSL